MCLAVPGKVLQIDRSATPVMGTVSFGGVLKRVCLDWLPEIAEGDYVIVHVGFALARLDEREAERTLDLFREAAGIQNETEEP